LQREIAAGKTSKEEQKFFLDQMTEIREVLALCAHIAAH
jgi:hypothetical protein